MNREHLQLQVVYLKAGEMYYTQAPSIVVTVLGSCLSVTMHHPRLGIAAICHGLLPECGRKNCANECPDRFKYVDCSLRKMFSLFDEAGAKRSEIEVKYFGGGDMFTRPIEKPGLASIGRQNILTAQAVLKQQGLTVATRDVGGLHGRKIYFYTQTGEVFLKRLTCLDQQDMQEKSGPISEGEIIA